MNFKSILCPVDFSEHARRALRYAEALARRYEARLTVANVAHPLLVQAAAVTYHVDVVRRDTLRELDLFVKETLPGTCGDESTAPQLLVRVGEAAEEILDLARETHADLIVMGTHGLAGYRKMFFGSTTERVLRHTSVHVLAVPALEVDPISVGADGPRFALGRILAPVDLCETTSEDAGTAMTLAQTFKVPLVLLHVVPEHLAAPRWRDQLAVNDRMRLARARQGIEQVAAALGGTVPIETLVTLGQPADEIAATAVEQGAGLIVMGLRRAGGLLGTRPGSIAYRVLCLAPAPVLVLAVH